MDIIALLRKAGYRVSEGTTPPTETVAKVEQQGSEETSEPVAARGREAGLPSDTSAPAAKTVVEVAVAGGESTPSPAAVASTPQKTIGTPPTGGVPVSVMTEERIMAMNDKEVRASMPAIREYIVREGGI